MKTIIQLQEEIDIIEDKIAKDSYISYIYSLKIINSRFIKGEKAMSKYSWESYTYSMNVLKARFILGEKAIQLSHQYWIAYKNRFLKNNNRVT